MSYILKTHLVKYKCSCEKFRPLDQLYMCRNCFIPKCSYCCANQVDITYCPMCFENITVSDAKEYKNRCANCYRCPVCGKLMLIRFHIWILFQNPFWLLSLLILLKEIALNCSVLIVDIPLLLLACLNLNPLLNSNYRLSVLVTISKTFTSTLRKLQVMRKKNKKVWNIPRERGLFYCITEIIAIFSRKSNLLAAVSGLGTLIKERKAALEPPPPISREVFRDDNEEGMKSF